MPAPDLYECGYGKLFSFFAAKSNTGAVTVTAPVAVLKKTPLDVKQNKSIREKVGEILQKIADKVMSYFKGDKEDGLLAHNAQAQVFIEVTYNTK